MANHESPDVVDGVKALGKTVGKGIDKVANMEIKDPASTDVVSAVGHGLKNSARFLNKLLGRSKDLSDRTKDPKFETKNHDLGSGQDKFSYSSSTETSEQLQRISNNLPKDVHLVPKKNGTPPSLSFVYNGQELAKVDFKFKEKSQLEAGANKSELTKLENLIPAASAKVSYLSARDRSQSVLGADVRIAHDSQGKLTYLKDGKAVPLSNEDKATLANVEIPIGPLNPDPAYAAKYNAAASHLRDEAFQGRVLASANTPAQEIAQRNPAPPPPAPAAAREVPIEPATNARAARDIAGVGTINNITVEEVKAVTEFATKLRSQEFSASSPQISPSQDKKGLVVSYRNEKNENISQPLSINEIVNPRNENMAKLLTGLVQVETSKVASERLALVKEAEKTFNNFKNDFPNKTRGVTVEINASTGAITFTKDGTPVFASEVAPKLSVPTTVNEKTDPKLFIDASQKLNDPKFQKEVREQVAANAKAAETLKQQQTEAENLQKAQAAEQRFKQAVANFQRKTDGVLAVTDNSGNISFTKDGKPVFADTDKDKPKLKVPTAVNAQTEVELFSAVTITLNDPSFHDQVKRQVAANAQEAARRQQQQTEAENLQKAQAAEQRFKRAQVNFQNKTDGVLVITNQQTGEISFTKGGKPVFSPEQDPKLKVPTAVDAKTDPGAFTKASMELENPSFLDKVNKQVAANAAAAELSAKEARERLARQQAAASEIKVEVGGTNLSSLDFPAQRSVFEALSKVSPSNKSKLSIANGVISFARVGEESTVTLVKSAALDSSQKQEMESFVKAIQEAELQKAQEQAPPAAPARNTSEIRVQVGRVTLSSAEYPAQRAAFEALSKVSSTGLSKFSIENGEITYNGTGEGVSLKLVKGATLSSEQRKEMEDFVSSITGK